MFFKSSLLAFILLFNSTFAFAQSRKVEEDTLELMEQWSLSNEQGKLAPISSPVEVVIDTVDGRIDSLRIELTNTQPPSMLSNKAVASGKRSAWLKNVSLVIRPTEDFYIWEPGEKGEKDRKGAAPFKLTGEAKVNIDTGTSMVRSLMQVSVDVLPYSGGYGATLNYKGERIPKPGFEESSVLTESGSNPVFTIQGFGKEYSMTVQGRVDVKMSDYKKLYEGTWYR